MKKKDFEQVELAAPETTALEKTPEQQAEEAAIGTDLTTVRLAEETSLLMAMLCEKLGLIPSKVTHSEFLSKFSEVQRTALDARKRLSEKFMLTSQPKIKQRRAKVVKLHE